MVKKISFFLMACVMSLMLIQPLHAKASNTDFYVNFAEPTTGNNQGYITLLLYKPSTGTYALNTWFWNSYYSSSDNIQMASRVIISMSGSTIQISHQNTGISYPLVNLFSINNSGFYRHRGTFIDSFTYTYSSDVIVGMKYNGNVQSVYLDREEVPFTINFNEDGSATLLQNQLNVLLDMYAQDEQMLSRITSIMNSNESIDDKMSELIDLQEESNSWLEKIFNLLEDAPEEEKKQASTQGGNSVSQGTDAIEDKGQGFTDSLGGLVNSMSYNGTDCSWTFPTVKLPAISGVMGETTLIQSQAINFGMWIDAIPSDIMLLIRSVLTMGLIVYCFKEFYDTIAYVLTLRRSDNE